VDRTALSSASHHDNNHGNPLPYHPEIIPDGHGWDDTRETKGVLYYLIIPVSLLFFATMTPEFRKITRIPILIAAFIGILMLVPLYVTISYPFFPTGAMITNVTNGFIILILVGFCGISPLVVFGLVNSAQISKRIRSKLLDKT